MKIKEALGIVAADYARSHRPVVHQEDPFIGLPDDVLEELRAILGPCQRAGLPIERDPTVPATVGVLVDNRLFRVSAVTDPRTGGMSAAILGPTLEPWDKETFLALIPDVPEPAAPSINFSDPPPIRRPQAEILEAILETQREILAELRRRP